MAKIEKIVIQGFKSFKRKVSIPFPIGFSVITGPNGSGKTNISDAICFVLGKTSARDLRAKKTHNLIFHGSKEKGSSEYAAVTLYFDNSASTLPIKEKNVSISRRINQRGVSTYRLNGRIVTRQQAVDLLSQAGIHPDGHNIIQQGDVNQIVEMDAISRREMIDEVAGILDYDDKKHKAEKELAKTEEKVREAEILLQEKENVMEKLRKERDAAVEYKELTGNLEKIRASILLKSCSETENELKKVGGELEEKNGMSSKLEKEIKELDQELANEEERLESLTKDVIQASSQIEATKRLARLQSEIERKQDRIESNKREIERLANLIERIRGMDKGVSPGLRKVLEFEGVHGFLSDLIIVPKQYRTAADIAAGSHMKDIVTDNNNTAVKAVKYLKVNRIGRARFLPLDRIKPYGRKGLPAGAIGWLSELIHHDPKYSNAVDYVFGTTACVKDIDKAKAIAKTNRVRMVTLDGDLFEASGAITGGYLKRKARGYETEVNEYLSEKKRLAKENESLGAGLVAANKELEILATKEKKTKTIRLERDRVKFDQRLRRIREKRKESYEKRLILQQEIGVLNIKKAKLEASFENLKIQLDEYREKDPKKLKDMGPFMDDKASTLNRKQREVTVSIEQIGPVNLKAIDDFVSIKDEFSDFHEKVDKIAKERESILDTVKKIEEKRKSTFDHTLKEIAKHFRGVYHDLTGGEAEISLEDSDNIESGLLIKASPSGKRLTGIDALSGGEKTITAFAFLFAIQNHKPSPFYILDEADATLDGSNTRKVVDLIRKQSNAAQFIVISHNDTLIRGADQVYGVSMEAGESKIMGVELPKDAN
jgi:chromosome segregation protein